MTQIYRQGDIMLKLVDLEINPGRTVLNPVDRRDGRVILAEGEVTGHAHAITDEKVTAWTFRNDPFVNWIVVEDEPATITHEEHGSIVLPVGTYEVVRQKTWDPNAAEFLWARD